jgi:hypothetical protein
MWDDEGISTNNLSDGSGTISGEREKSLEPV